ncbi:MAG: hypothetical protein NWF00_05585 [Candidatus Bathyarchaeota archaeon]|nr:hypothetical protein [Candidatus Bathyarchaeota archaeon]
MTKTDEVLDELKMASVAFMNSFFPFEYEDTTYRLVDYYVAFPWIKCEVCYNYPIQYVSVVRSSDGQDLHLCDECIDLITKRRVSEWFKKFRAKNETVTSNRRYIDGIDSILTAHKRRPFAIQMPEKDLDELQKTLEQLCNGFEPSRKQQQLAECYMELSGFI